MVQSLNKTLENFTSFESKDTRPLNVNFKTLNFDQKKDTGLRVNFKFGITDTDDSIKIARSKLGFLQTPLGHYQIRIKIAEGKNVQEACDEFKKL